MRFEDKIAIVTGGASGIGKEVATRFVAEGGSVVINGRDRAKAEAAAHQIDHAPNIEMRRIIWRKDIGSGTSMSPTRKLTRPMSPPTPKHSANTAPSCWCVAVP